MTRQVRPPYWIALALAVAAVLLLRVLDRGPAGGASVLSLTVRPFPEDVAPVTGPLAPGSSYRLELELERDAFCLIFVLDARGQARLLHPMGNLRPVPGRRPVLLPSEDGGLAWRLPETGGPLLFVAVATTAGALDPLRLEHELAERCADRDSYEDARAEMLGLLDRRVGPPRAAEIRIET